MKSLNQDDFEHIDQRTDEGDAAHLFPHNTVEWTKNRKALRIREFLIKRVKHGKVKVIIQDSDYRILDVLGTYPDFHIATQEIIDFKSKEGAA